MSNWNICFGSRILKNREKVVIIPEPPLNHPIKISNDENAKRERLEQAKLAIGRIIVMIKNLRDFFWLIWNS